MNRWSLTEEVKQKYTPVVKEFLESLKVPSSELREKDFSDTELNPYTLWELLESLGYKKGDQCENGWEMDFWIPFTKDGEVDIEIVACGQTFELILREKE